jgi:ribosomal-protein-alanine N-acetyltransferase
MRSFIVSPLNTNFQPFPVIRTQRLLMREIGMHDVEASFRHRSDPELYKHLLRSPATHVSEAEDFIRRVMAAQQNGDGIHWGLELLENPGYMIGNIGIWQILKSDFRGVLGYMLEKEHHGKGYMSEALEEVIRYGFDKIGLHTIKADVTYGNFPSMKLLERHGFIQEAHFKDDCFKDGKFLDTVVYGMVNRNQLI